MVEQKKGEVDLKQKNVQIWPVPDEEKFIPKDGRDFGKPRGKGDVRKHCGIDLAYRNPSEPGMIVVATEDGKVVKSFIFTRPPTYNTTYCLLIAHKSGIVVNYGEIQKSYVKKGVEVIAGEKIAEIGRVGKGKANTSMLHFELYTKGTTSTTPWAKDDPQPKKLLNPREYLTKCEYKTLSECEELLKKKK